MGHKQKSPNLTLSYIDSCGLNPQESEGECTRRLLILNNEGEINLVLPGTVKNEISHPRTPGFVEKRAAPLVFSNETSLTEEELKHREDIRTLVRGNAKPGAHQNDADHLYDLVKFGGGYFITTDNRLLRMTETLFGRYRVTTITPCDYEKLLKCAT